MPTAASWAHPGVIHYLTSIRRGRVYGWLYVHYGDSQDPRGEQDAPELVARAISPDYALGLHFLALGLAFTDGACLGSRFAEGAFIGQLCSWNRRPAGGYFVVFVPDRRGRPAGLPIEVVGGVGTPQGAARGRTAGVATGADGASLMAEAAGNAICRVMSVD